MYIAKVKTGTSKNGTTYYTHRLLSTHKVGITGKVQQRLVLNLGAGYSFPKELWPNLCERIEEIMLGTPKLFLTSPEVEQEAQRIAHLINQKINLDGQEKTHLAGYFLEDIECMKHRSIGAEYVSLHAAEQLQLSSILSSLDFTEEQIHWCLALIIGRMVNPGSKRSTFHWLQHASALGELIGKDFNTSSSMSLYRTSDLLLSKKDEIEDLLYNNLPFKNTYDDTVALFDLTNTYYEGQPGSPKLKHGFSKEKRSDCLLISLAIVIDCYGFIKKSMIFPGNISEQSTLKIIVNSLNSPLGTMFIMDRGIATSENINWLNDNGYRYLVISREKKRAFDFNLGKPLVTAGGDTVSVYSEIDDETLEKKLMCHSPKREYKETSMLRKRMKNTNCGSNNLMNLSINRELRKIMIEFCEQLVASLKNILEFPIIITLRFRAINLLRGQASLQKL